jgi:hypothetical protein
MNLFYLVMIMFALRYFFAQIDHFHNDTHKESKSCSQQSINNAYTSYLFGQPYFAR